jgi:hypothetical protein
VLESARRKKPLFALFVDLKAAYNRVPHQALLRVLADLELLARVRGLVVAEYAAPTTRFRVGGISSASVSVPVGVRQGCRLSPVLFDLYINGLARELEGRRPLLGESRIPALFFADDLVLLAESESELQASADIVTAWCDRW